MFSGGMMDEETFVATYLRMTAHLPSHAVDWALNWWRQVLGDNHYSYWYAGRAAQLAGWYYSSATKAVRDALRAARKKGVKNA